MAGGREGGILISTDPAREGHPPSEFQGGALRSVIGGALAVSVGLSSLVIFSFSVLLKPVSEAFGWGRGQASLAFSIGALTVALYGYAFTVFALGGAASPALMGAGLDYFGNYQAMLGVMALCGAAATGLIAFSNLPARSRWEAPVYLEKTEGPNT